MKIVVDLFNQHSGSIDELKRMALSAWISGADVVKIQILNSKRIWGDDSRKYLEMSDSEVDAFFNFCKSNDIPFSTTIFDERGLDILKSWQESIPFFKIASVTAKNDPELTQKVIDLSNESKKDAYLSTGLIKNNKYPFHGDFLQYLWCSSEYPTFLGSERLREMPYFGPVEGKLVGLTRYADHNEDCTYADLHPFEYNHNRGYYGYSDHCVGISAAIEAYRRGARLLEKHFTTDNNVHKNGEMAHLCSFNEETLKQFKNIIREYGLFKDDLLLQSKHTL